MIIDLLMTAPDEQRACSMLDQIGWRDNVPFRCRVAPVSLWRRLPDPDVNDEGEHVVGYWLGLCIPDCKLLPMLWQLPGVVAALDRESGQILQLKGFSLEDVNALETIQPVWAGSNYAWGNLEMVQEVKG